MPEAANRLAGMLALAPALALALASGAQAQVPPDIAAKVRELGQSMDPPKSQIYGHLFGPDFWRGITITRDIAFGADEKQKLDLYVPDEKATGRTVLVFVHGGGFVGGDKKGAYYPDNVTGWAAKHGMIGVNINYRLAPANTWPAATDDLKAALAWVRANIAQHGGDPARIVLMGHSAGANHVADYASTPALQGPEFASVRGAVLLSPFYAPAPTGSPHPYYGTVEERQLAPAAIGRLAAAKVPLFLGYAEYDPDNMKTFARSLVEGMCDKGLRCLSHVYLRDQNHFTEGMTLGTADQSLAGPLLGWLSRL